MDDLRQAADQAEAAQEWADDRVPVRQSMTHLEKAGPGKKGLAVCQQIVMNRFVRAMLIFLLGVTSPVRKEFGESIIRRKTKWGTEEWLHMMCSGELARRVLSDIFNANYDDELAKRMGLSPSLGRGYSEFSNLDATKIAHDCECLQRNLIKREHEFFLYFQNMPFLRWAGLYHRDTEVVKETVMGSRNMWLALQRVEEGRWTRGAWWTNWGRRFC